LDFRNTAAMRALLQYQCERARTYYRSANHGIPKLDADSRTTVYLMSLNYEKILDQVVRCNYNVFDKRVSTSLLTKLASVPKAWWLARHPPA
jgi:phytoene synthase